MTRDDLRAWLERRPPVFADLAGPREALRGQWRLWFAWDFEDGDTERPVAVEYLGERSARVGPDKVPAVQPCGCAVCRGSVAP